MNYLLEVEQRKRIAPTSPALSLFGRIRIDDVRRCVARAYEIDIKALDASNRRDHIAMAARHVAMYLSRELVGSSFNQIARSFGVKDHATVMHACDKIERRMDDDPKYRAAVEQISQDIRFIADHREPGRP